MKKWGLGGGYSFWSVAIAVGFYCLILGISIGSMFDKPACTDSHFGCFEFWINRYQTLLTAFGVIFAVVIAKAQMDLNRRQHSVNLFESKQSELDALIGVVAYCGQLTNERGMAFNKGANITEAALNLTYRASMFLPFSISQAFSRLHDEVVSYNQTDRRAVIIYGGNESDKTDHSSRCWLIFTSALLLSKSANDRIKQIHALAPSTQISPDFIL